MYDWKERGNKPILSYRFTITLSYRNDFLISLCEASHSENVPELCATKMVSINTPSRSDPEIAQTRSGQYDVDTSPDERILPLRESFQSAPDAGRTNALPIPILRRPRSRSTTVRTINTNKLRPQWVCILKAEKSPLY